MTIQTADFQHRNVRIININILEWTPFISEQGNPARHIGKLGRMTIAFPLHLKIGAIPNYVYTSKDLTRRNEKPSARCGLTQNPHS